MSLNVSQVAVRATSVMKIDGPSKRPRREPFVVSMLPFPKTASYTARWQKQFRHTLISWAAAHLDPYGTNSVLSHEIVLSIWEAVYPDARIGGDDNDPDKYIAGLIQLVSRVSPIHVDLPHAKLPSAGAFFLIGVALSALWPYQSFKTSSRRMTSP